MKKAILIGAVSAAVVLASCTQAPTQDSKDASAIVEDVPTCQAFLKEPLPEADLQRIVNAGVNAPSAMNMQPWHFTVVTDEKVIGELASAQKMPPMPKDMPMGMPPGAPAGMPKGDMPKPPTGKGPRSGLGDSPAAIFISCRPGGEFDAGLACEAMNDMANLLGYGTKIVSSVKMIFAGENKAELYGTLQVPEGQEIVAAILVGKADTEKWDAVASATPRNAFEEVVSIVK